MNQKLSEMVRKAKPFANRYYKLKEERKALRKELQEADADDEDDKDDLNEVAKK